MSRKKHPDVYLQQAYDELAAQYPWFLHNHDTEGSVERDQMFAEKYDTLAPEKAREQYVTEASHRMRLEEKIQAMRKAHFFEKRDQYLDLVDGNGRSRALAGAVERAHRDGRKTLRVADLIAILRTDTTDKEATE